MTLAWISGLFCLLWGMSFLFTGVLRRYLLVNCLDIPNERSSHRTPVIRGGGLAFAGVFLFAVLMSGISMGYSAFLLALLWLGTVVAMIGCLDDWLQINTGIRFLVQLTLATTALYWIGFFHQGIGLYRIAYALFGILYLTGLINVFNFLDGIDGYAALESTLIAISMALLHWLDGAVESAFLLGCFASSVLGFLWWNFPPAKLFMGDVGSGFLGGILGLFSLQDTLNFPHHLFSWVILMGVFIADGGVTLLFRILRKERFWQAHRQHAYQHLAHSLQSHRKVTLGALVINMGWLLPWAVMTWYQWCSPIIGLIAAYVPLVMLAVYWRAGRPAAIA